MIPAAVTAHLRQHSVPFTPATHPRAVSAQILASTMHVSGKRVAKSVIVRADDTFWIALLPANETVDLERLGQALNAQHVRLATEEEFARLFPDCEVGAEPPFGSLFHMPVIVEETLSRCPRIIVRAGSHEDTVELAFEDFAALEWPRQGSFRARSSEEEEEKQEEQDAMEDEDD